MFGGLEESMLTAQVVKSSAHRRATGCGLQSTFAFATVIMVQILRFTANANA